MSGFERLFCCRRQKKGRFGHADLGRDITFALFIKFCLLAILWWSFFAGKKVPVDAGSMARALLNAPPSHLQEKP